MPDPRYTPTDSDRQRRAEQLVRDGDMRIEVVKREVNQGALAGFDSRITDYAAALIVVALDSYDDHLVSVYGDAPGFRDEWRI